MRLDEIVQRISKRNRKRKLDLFTRLLEPTATTSVLDVGVTGGESLETENFLEKHYPYRSRITALGVDDLSAFRTSYPDMMAVQFGGGIFPFISRSFDICWSNAVIEHVGGLEKQLLFIREIHRVAKVAFVTTPNRHFPIEVHTRLPLMHLLPKKLFDRVLLATGRGWASGNYMNLLSAKVIRRLLRECGITDYSIVRNRFLGFTLDFVIIIH